MNAKFQIDHNELIEEMDLQMEMALNCVLNRANDGTRVKNGVVNDGDCIDEQCVVIVKINHVGEKDSCVDFREYMVSVTDDHMDHVVIEKSNEVTKHIRENWNYHGSIVTDAYISMTTFSDDYLGFLQISRDDHDLPQSSFKNI